jgi:DNA-binding CsgD family transcriptional regulator
MILQHRAGARAQRAYAWLGASERYEAALALLDERDGDPAERGWLLARLMRLRRHSDMRRALGYAERAHHLATLAGDAGLAAYSLFHQGHLRCRFNDLRQGLRQAAAGVAAQEALPAESRQRLAARRAAIGDPSEGREDAALLALWLSAAGRAADVVPLAERLLAEVSTSGVGGAYARWALAMVENFQGRWPEARQLFAEARAGFAALGRHFEAGQTAFIELIEAIVPYAADRPGLRERVAAEGEAAWQRTGDATAGESAAPFMRLPLLTLAGAWDEAWALGMAIRAGAGANRLYGIALLLPIARARGARAPAADLLREALPDGPATAPGDAWLATALLVQRAAAGLALDAGDLPQASAWLAAHDRWLAWSHAAWGRAGGALAWAAYHRAAGDVEAAHARATQALALAAEPRQALALLAAHRLLGELATAEGRHADARARLDAALALADACAAPYERALTLIAMAELRAARGERGGARRRLDEARRLCARLAARPALARIAALHCRVVGPDPSRSAARDAFPADLTAREVAVLRLIAAGRTNVAIATDLGISPNTVLHHVTHILTKTGAENRAAAVAFALRHGLVR